MVVLAPNSSKGRLWADRALARIRQEAKAIGVDVNEEKTRVVTVTEPHVSFAFLGFDLRWQYSKKNGKSYAHREPRPKKVLALQAAIKRSSTRTATWR